jgi:tRNA-splicing ligase RtcB
VSDIIVEMQQTTDLKRVNDHTLRLENPNGPEATIFATTEVPIERSAVRELSQFLEVSKTVRTVQSQIPGFFGEVAPTVKRVSVTPDFHKGAGVPIGTVIATQGFLIPQAIGNDVNCGMRVHTTGLTRRDVEDNLDGLETKLRHLFFEGGRNIPMTRLQREALFRQGLFGLLDAVPKSQDAGLWSFFHQLDVESHLERIHSLGSLQAQRVLGLDDFLGPESGLSRDAQIGSIGGGNHFVELQVVDKILDGTIAHAWGLKKGQVVVMVHTGSVMIGHLCGQYYRQVVKKLFPGGVNHPDNGVFFLPTHGRFESETAIFKDALHNAANFAFANRMFLALIALKALNEVCGESESSLLYDAPHNLVWEDELDGQKVFLHRKGACPARGVEAMAGTPFAYYGEPVLVPGSMGASSFLLAGQGNADSLFSASHGAGRALSRGQAMKADDKAFQDFLKRSRVVTPVDFRRPDLRMRPDILNEKLADIKKEAPFAYKGIGPVIDTLRRANIAKPVVELHPLLTVKG